MKILFLNYEYPPLGGGAGNATKFLMKEYAKIDGIEVDCIVSSIDDQYHLETEGDSIRIHRIPIGKNSKKMKYQSQWEILKYSWKSYFFAQELLRKQKYTLVHAFFTVPCGAVGYLLGRKFTVPLITSLRGADVPGFSDRFSWLYQLLKPLIVFIWKKSDRVISNSQGLKELALKSSPNQTIDIIYNGVDTQKFIPASEEHIAKRDGDTVTILCASRLSKRKGFTYAIKAFEKILAKHPNVKLIIAGGKGDAFDELDEQVKDLKLQDKVIFFGEYTADQLITLQQNADIFLLPSFNEGMSNSLLEAFASGLPVLMTPTGGAQELVQDGKNGFLINFADSEDIFTKAEKIITNKALRDRMRQTSRATAERMKWENVAAQYMEVYKSLV